MKVYSAPDAPGTQLTGELTYTRDGCTIEVHGAGRIWPAVAVRPESSNPAENCGEGSGINPDFAGVRATRIRRGSGALRAVEGHPVLQVELKLS